jgi:hypothetical protein
VAEGLKVKGKIEITVFKSEHIWKGIVGNVIYALPSYSAVYIMSFLLSILTYTGTILQLFLLF